MIDPFKDSWWILVGYAAIAGLLAGAAIWALVKEGVYALW